MEKIKKIFRNFGFKIVKYETLPFNKRILEFYDTASYLLSILKSNSIKGDFVECGFGYGRSFVCLSYIAAKNKFDIYGLDSFEGFPKVQEIDNRFKKHHTGEWYVRNLNEANKCIKDLGIFGENSNFYLIKIVFDKNANNPIPDKRISFLHLDLDLYEGYKYSLEMFYDQVCYGGIILFDEYKEMEWPGATKAVDEFLQSRNIPQNRLQEYNGKFYLIKR